MSVSFGDNPKGVYLRQMDPTVEEHRSRTGHVRRTINVEHY